MKFTLFIVSLLISSSVLIGCGQSGRHSTKNSINMKYILVINYLKENNTIESFLRSIGYFEKNIDRPICFKVADRTVLNPSVFFTDEVVKRNYNFTYIDSSNMELFLNLSERIEDSLLTVDKLRSAEYISISGLSNLSQTSTSDIIIFFSPPYKNNLVVSVFFYPFSNQTYENVTAHNIGLYLLFIFNDFNEIKYVYETDNGTE